MAARRERDRRRPSAQSRYRFATPESVVESEESAAEPTQAIDAPNDRQSRTRRAALPDQHQTAATTRGGARTSPLPFSAYASEYAYVLRDLRRVVLVIGSLLVILILLNFVLPH